MSELAVTTGERVPEMWIRQTLAPLAGENLPLMQLAQAEKMLRRHSWVQGADLRKDLPARLSVRVTERQAVALLRDGNGLHYLDTAGRTIAPFDPRARVADLPLVSVTDRPNEKATPATLRCAVELLSEIDDVQPSWATDLSEVEILGEEEFRVHTANLPFPVLVRAGTLHQKARRLEALLPHIVERYGAAAAIDLRFARRIIVQPSVTSGAGRPPRPAPQAEHREAATDHAQRG